MTDLLPYGGSDRTQRFELEHGWEFIPDRTGRLTYAELARAEGWRPARAGLSWNVQFDDLRDYMGAAWYRIAIEIPRFSDMRHVLLKFGAVDYFCELYVNSRPIGTHEGGYTPFSFDITAAVHPGMNIIALRVIDPPMNEAENRELFPDMMYNEIPHGKQNWYVQNSGIWQGVRMEFCPSIYIDRVDVTPQFSGAFDAMIRIAGAGLTAEEGEVARRTTATVSIYDNAGRSVFKQELPVTDTNILTLSGTVPHRKLWSPDQPSLYTMDVTLSGAVQYKRRLRFGFRSLEARDGKFFLNGKPIYLIASLDQDFYPETIHTPASEEFVRDMMMKAKKLGFNVLRCHLKVAHPVYLDVADELGMLVWAEMPSWSDCWFACDHFSMRAALRGEHMFTEIMARDWNHPCIVIRTVMNESWGINLQQLEQRQWLKEIYERVKDTLAPLGRLVIDNSPCEGNFHIKTDIDDFHQYYSMPDQVSLWDKWLDEFASRPPWTFSPHGDAERTGKEPLVVSEFGNWGLPTLPIGEDLPWWFHYSFGGREVTNPAGVFERFHEFGFGSVFRDYNDFAEESQWHQYISLKYEIESMRAKEPIQGYVLTAMTDVHWEVNGVLDMWRKPKIFSDELSLVQQQDVILARTSRHTCFTGEELEADILLSHYSDRALRGARVRWSTDSGMTGHVDLQDEPASPSVTHIAHVRWKSLETDTPKIDRLYLEIRLRTGAHLAENTLDFFIVPSSQQTERRNFTFRDGAKVYPELERRLRSSGSEGSETSDLLIATSLDADAEHQLANGKTVLLLIDSAEALPPDSSLKATLRKGTELEGRWFSNFNWIRMGQEPFKDVSFNRVLGFESRAAVPGYIIEGIAAADFDDVLSGITYGWLRKNSGLVVQSAVNGGRLLVTTFRFHEYGADAYSTALLHGLMRYAASSGWQPKLRIQTSVAEER